MLMVSSNCMYFITPFMPLSLWLWTKILYLGGHPPISSPVPHLDPSSVYILVYLMRGQWRIFKQLKTFLMANHFLSCVQTRLPQIPIPTNCTESILWGHKLYYTTTIYSTQALLVVACYPNLEGYDLDVSDLPAKRLAMTVGDGDTSQGFQTCLNIWTSVYDRLN